MIINRFPPLQSPQERLCIAEAATCLDCSKGVVYEMVNAGQLEATCQSSSTRAATFSPGGGRATRFLNARRNGS